MSSRYSSQVKIFWSATTPDQTFDLIPTVGDLWMDISLSPPITKKCTSINPFVWVSIEGGGSTTNFADAEVPAGTIDGVNTTFTLAHAPNPAASLQLDNNGVVLKGGGVDYTLLGLTITFTTAPAIDDSLLSWYRF